MLERVPVVGSAPMTTRPLVLGHRGASRAAPGEHHRGVSRAARELGADGVELDVRRTSDGVLVVHHDPRSTSCCSSSSRSRVGRHPDVPTLDEALATCAACS